ncbi:MAG: Na+/H+ antiporter NhaC family protein [bacterium]
MSRRTTLLFVAGVLAAGVLLRLTTDLFSPAAGGTDHGVWSLVPAVLAIALCFWTREVITALFAGIAAGGLISGQFNIIQHYFFPALGTESFAQILLVYLWCLGGLIGIWTRTGGAVHFARWLGDRIVRGPRSARVFTVLLGSLFHQGGTVSAILTGSTARPVCDEEGLSHEETSFLVDATASPIATLIPFNVWPAYVGAFAVGTAPFLADIESAKALFYAAVPFNFIGILALLTALLFALEIRPFPFGRMREAARRARETGALDREGSKPMASRELNELKVPPGYRTGNSDFIVPIGTLLAVAILPWILPRLTGDAFGSVAISEAFLLAILAAMVTAAVKGMALEEIIEGFLDGVKGVSIGAVILALAVTLGEVSGALGAADFLIRTTAGRIVPFLLPALLLTVSLAVAFSIGSSWSMYAVVVPIALPLAWALLPEPVFLTLCYAAVIGGGAWGDWCSPISDTTILSSLSTGSDLMDHASSQLPIGILVAAVSLILYAAAGLAVT